MVSSCGGHFMELMQLLPAIKDHDFYIVTEKNIASKAIVEKYKHHYLVQQERKSISFLFKFAYNIIASLFFLVKENPTIIISTGAGASYPTCKFGKMRRTRQTLWSAVQMLTQKLCCQTIHDCPKVVPLHYESE